MRGGSAPNADQVSATHVWAGAAISDAIAFAHQQRASSVSLSTNASRPDRHAESKGRAPESTHPVSTRGTGDACSDGATVAAI